MSEDRALEPLKRRARLQPEVIDQHHSRVLISGERVSLPAGAIERQHQ